MSLLAQVPLRTTPGPPPPLMAVGVVGVRPQGLVLYQAQGHIDQYGLEPVIGPAPKAPVSPWGH